jgi:Na+/H+ antiporter NhaC
MKKLILLSVLCLFLAGEAFAFAPVLGVKVSRAFTGTPLVLEVDLGNVDGLRADVYLDGQKIATERVRRGENTLTYTDLEFGPGEHEIRLQSGSVSVEVAFNVLPGWLSLLPPILAIALALLFRDVLIALSMGVFCGALVLYDWNPFAAFGRSIDSFIVPALADPDHAAILVFTALLGGMVGLVTRSGGTHGIVDLLRPYATTPRRGQVATWLMGVMVFFDDYANTLIVGPTMRPITDKLRISREKLAYLVDSTAAPVVCLFPISTWVGFEIGLIGDAFKQLDLPYDAYSTFVASIPYRFYPIFALVMVLTLALSRRDFGPMKEAEERARTTGQVLAEGARPIADYSSQEVEAPEGIAKRAVNAIAPILTVVGVTMLGLYLTGAAGLTRGVGDSFPTWIRIVMGNADSYKALLWGSAAGVAVALFLPLAQRIFKLTEGMTALVAGCKAMYMAFMVLILAWSLSAICGELNTAQYLVGFARDSLAATWLPALTFLLAAAISFATGSAWGSMAIIEPLLIPIAHNLSLAAGHEVGSETYNTVLLASIASVLAGSVWGDHCSPISDTTILSSMASGCDHIAHVRTQIPYALMVGSVAVLLGCIPVSFGFPAWASLLLGVAVLVGGVMVFGHRREEEIPV